MILGFVVNSLLSQRHRPEIRVSSDGESIFTVPFPPTATISGGRRGTGNTVTPCGLPLFASMGANSPHLYGTSCPSPALSQPMLPSAVHDRFTHKPPYDTVRPRAQQTRSCARSCARNPSTVRVHTYTGTTVLTRTCELQSTTICFACRFGDAFMFH